MPFLKTKTDLTLLRVPVVQLVDDELNPLRERLTEGRHTGLFKSQTDKETSGWMPLLDAERGAFDDINLWVSDDRHVVALAYRTDKRRVPAQLLRREVNARVKAWCDERGVTRAPRVVTKEIRERLELDLLQKALPTTRLTGVLWMPSKGEIWLDTVSPPRVDLLRRRLSKLLGGTRTFLLAPLDAVRDATERESLSMSTPTSVTRVISDAAAEEIRSSDTLMPSHLASAFLAWFWMHTSSDTAFNLPRSGQINAWIDGRMGFRHGEARNVTTLLTAENADRQPEAKAAYLAGEPLVQIKMAIKRDDREYAVMLDGPMLTRKGMTLIASSSEDAMSALYDCTLQIEEVETILRELFVLFAARVYESGFPLLDEDIRGWLGKDDASWEDA